MELIVICIIPDNSSIDEIRKKYSESLSSKKALHLPPHLTLVGRFYTKDYDAFLEALEKECQKFKKFTLEFTEIGYFEDSHILYLKPLKNKHLHSLHNIFLDIVSGFREAWTRDALKIETGNQIQQEYIRKFGSPFVKEFYNPHITLAGPDVSGEIMTVVNKLPQKVSIHTNVNEIVILRKIEESWSVDKKIKLQL